MRRATASRSSIGVDVPPVTPTVPLPSKADASRRAAGDPISGAGGPALPLASGGRGARGVGGRLDRGGGGADYPAQRGELARVGAVAPADDDHQLDQPGRLDGVLLAADRHRADGVHDLELVAAPDHEGSQLLELPGRLGALADERHALAPGGALPLLLLVDDDRVGGVAEHPDDLGMLRRAEDDDDVALLDEPGQLAALLDDPRARPIDDLEAAAQGARHARRGDPVRADH